MPRYLMKLQDLNTGALKQIFYEDSSVGFTTHDFFNRPDPELDEVVNIINFNLREGLDDQGEAPAGKPDECFYCRIKRGQYHKPTCVLIKNVVKYTVDFAKVRLGTFSTSEPIRWDTDMCEFHKNESSWCKDNALDNLVLDDNDSARYAMLQIEKMIDEHFSCACSLLTFNYLSASHWPPGQDRFELWSVQELEEGKPL